MTSVADLTIRDARDAIVSGKLCPVSYVECFLERIAALNPVIHAFITVDADRAVREARKRRDKKTSDTPQPLFGIPFAVKDIIDVEGSPTSCQSRAGFTRPAGRSAQCVQSLIAAGGIYLGKLTLYEFALGGPSFGEPWPPARNPWNTDFMPGSSSSGAGSALAADMVPLAIGTDSGGSIRSPAMMNGIVGLKPTFGRVSTDGLFPLAPSMDTVGPMARTVEDVALAFDCLVDEPSDRAVAASDRPPRIGRVDHLWRYDVSPSADVETAIDAAVEDLTAAGADIVGRKLAPLRVFNAVGWTTLFTEAFDVHRAGLVEHPELYGTPVRDMLLTGAFFTADDYVRAQRLRLTLSQAIDEALSDADCLLTAVSALPPCRLDDQSSLDELARASIRIPCNVTGHPALALPVGFSDSGLPIGIQLIGRKGHERALLSVGRWIEAHVDGWSRVHRPPMIENREMAAL